jgi:hypothetical protein
MCISQSVNLLQACISYRRASLTGGPLLQAGISTGVYLIGVPLLQVVISIGMHLIGVHLLQVCISQACDSQACVLEPGFLGYIPLTESPRVLGRQAIDRHTTVLDGMLSRLLIRGGRTKKLSAF